MADDSAEPAPENADAPAEDSFSVDWTRHWLLEGGTAHLNHGSFGACPKRVLKRQSELRKQMERQPVRFFEKELYGLLDKARAELAAFVGCETDGLAFVTNTTAGVNAVLRSRDFDPGDELLVTNHAYPACRNALEFVAERAGARVTVADIPFPLDDPDAAVDAILEAVTPRTELALIDHVTSQTGLVLPVGRLCEQLDQRHVDTLVDGAHAPGMLDLEVEALGCTYYVGNCHKWLCAPKGAAFLWVEPYERDDVDPLAISNHYRTATEQRSRYHMAFDWTGTRDPTPYLCIPEAIDFLGQLLPGGWDGLRDRNHRLALQARDLLCEALDIEPPAPDAMLGALAAVPLPGVDKPADAGPFWKDPLKTTLSEEYGLEVPVMEWGPTGRLLRVSAQLYNHREHYEALADALTDTLDR